jgi:hypothetical protein
VNGQCPLGDCDAGWIPGTCSEGKEFLLAYYNLCLINRILNVSELEQNLPKNGGNQSCE